MDAEEKKSVELAERERCRAIIEAPAPAHLAETARYLAFHTDRAVDQALEILKIAEHPNGTADHPSLDAEQRPETATLH